MINKKIVQKRTICVALVVALIALIAVFAVAGLDSPAQTAYADPEPEHTHNGITFTAWDSATSLPTVAGSYYLTQDVTLANLNDGMYGSWVPFGWWQSGEVTLCLNGHSITQTANSTIICVNNAATVVNIYDCGCEEHRYMINEEGVAVVDDDLTEDYKTFTGGYLTGANVDGSGGGAVVRGTLNLYGGTFIGNKANSGGAIYPDTNGKFYMYGGALIGNKATHNNGGAIFMNNYNGGQSQAYLYGGTITDNYATPYNNQSGQAFGGAIYTYWGPKLVIGSRQGYEPLVISGNYGLDYLKRIENNVYVDYDVHSPIINVDFDPDFEGAISIGVSSNQYTDETVITSAFDSAEDVEKYKGYFHSDRKNFALLVADGNRLKLQKKPPHSHNFTYVADGATITATCSDDDEQCELESKQISVTIVAPTLTQEGGEGSSDAMLIGMSDFSQATGKYSSVEYFREGTEYAVYDQYKRGKYRAQVTIDDQTAYVEYEIGAPAEHIYVAGVDILTATGGVVDADTEEVVGTVSGSATLTFGDTEEQLILTLENFQFSGDGYVVDDGWYTTRGAIWLEVAEGKTLTIVLVGDNSIAYKEYGIYSQYGTGVKIVFEGDGKLQMEDDETTSKAAVYFQSNNDYSNLAAVEVRGGEIEFVCHYGKGIDGYPSFNVYEGKTSCTTANGVAFNCSSVAIYDGEVTVVSTDKAVVNVMDCSCMVWGGNLDMRAEIATPSESTIIAIRGGLYMYGGTVNIVGYDVGVEQYGATYMTAGDLTIQAEQVGIRASQYAWSPVFEITKGRATIIGGESAITLPVVNSMSGLGWTDVAGTEGKTTIAIETGEEGQTLDASLKMVVFVGHEHVLTYTAEGNVITATCSAENCSLPENKATLTLVAPAGSLVYDGNAKTVTIQEGYDTSAFPNATIVYYKDNEVVESCVNAGAYTAQVTFDDATAQVTFIIENWVVIEEEKGVSVEIEGAEYDVNIEVEVEVTTDLQSEESQADYSAVLADKIDEDEEVAIVYDVKLILITIENGVETKTVIQPSDIKPDTTLLVRMDIPEELRGKTFKVVHIHSANDVELIDDYTVSEDGSYLIVRINRLSEFAFVTKKATAEPIEPTDPTDPSELTEPTDPTDPIEPNDPTDPTDPTEPAEPTEPADPTDATDPEEGNDGDGNKNNAVSTLINKAKEFCPMWYLILLDIALFLFLGLFLILGRKRILGVLGLLLAIALLAFSIYCILDHVCIITIISVAVSGLFALIFLFALIADRNRNDTYSYPGMF